jgi:hypothetical protein
MGKSPHAGQDITWLLEIIEAEKQKSKKQFYLRSRQLKQRLSRNHLMRMKD